MRFSLQKFSPDFVRGATGISSEDLEAVADLYMAVKKRGIVFGSGVTQHANGTEIVKALCNLALLTGETEEEGGGVYPMLSQSNAQGAFDMGAFSESLPGHQRLDDQKAREKFEEAWGRKIPAEPGFTYGEMFDRILEGKIKALYILGEDPFITLPNLERLETAIRHLEFLVVQDQFMPKIGSYANVVLPGVSFAEKDGTFTSMERRIQRVKEAILPVSNSRPDWKILCDLSTRMGYPMEYGGPSEVMAEISSLVPLYAHATYQNVEKAGIQWPLTNGKKRTFFSIGYREPIEQPDEEYPLWILPRGFHYHYGIGTAEKRAKGLAKVFPETALEINPYDAQRVGVKDSDPVKVISPRGEVETICRVSQTLPEGMAYFATQFFPVPINNLLIPQREPVSGTPEYKVCIGRIERR